MKLFVGEEACDFTARAVMPDNTIDESFNLRKYLDGKKGVLFFYPLNFTFVCPSEIIAFNNRLSLFTSRNAKLMGISVDSHFSHFAWKNMPINKGGVGAIQFPLVSDLNKEISIAYNVLNSDAVALRGTFLIDEEFNIRHYLVNDLPIGRNVDEILRVIDALDHHKKYGDVCPAGWQKGDNSMSPTQEGVIDYLITNAENL